MPDAAFRMFLDGRSASPEELDRVEEITVEQEMDMAWEATLRLGLCVDSRGAWLGQADDFSAPFSRIRIELRVGSGSFVPLIDGPVVGYETSMSSQPGRSTATVTARDDSVLLNREEAVEVFENRSDADLAREMFSRFGVIDRIEVADPDGVPGDAVRRGTVMQFLRDQARLYHFHAFVLPGEEPGRSIGCFQPEPEDPSDLPAFVLLGDGRNVEDVTIEEDSTSPERTLNRTLRLEDGNIASATSSTQDLPLMDPLPPVPQDLAAVRLVPPEDNFFDDPEVAARAQNRDASYALRVSGRVLPGCYPAVLAPYQKIMLRAGKTRYSGLYLLTRVTHRITLNLYSQEFQALSDSSEDVDAAASPAGGGGLPPSDSAALSVF